MNALKAAGNAIVPQIAYEIMKAILAVEGILELSVWLRSQDVPEDI